MGLREVLGYLEKSHRDENLLSSRERELLTNILRQTKSCGADSQVAASVESILSRAVGETLLHRASEAAGRSVLEEIESDLAEGQGLDDEAGRRLVFNSTPPPPTGPRPPSPSGPPGPHLSIADRRIFLNAPPPPATGPRPPSPSGPPGPRPNVAEKEIFLNSPPPPATGPRPPSPSGPPGPRQSVVACTESNASVVVQESYKSLPANCVIFDEFLAPSELQRLTEYTLAHEADFQISEVISPGVVGGVIDPEYRRSRVLMELGEHEGIIRARIEAALPRVLEKLEMASFPISRFEAQITASNHGDFFRHHSDNAEEEIARRQLTYVYFFHREPKAFEGGELRLHDASRQNGTWVSSGNYKAVVPLQNQIVFFPSGILHEITPVVCPSQAFADSRFTVNGWLHR